MGKSSSVEDEGRDDGYEFQDYDGSTNGSLGKTLIRYANRLNVRKSFRDSFNQLPIGRFYIAKGEKKYQVWWFFIMLVALYSSMFTPIEFAFFRGLPRELWAIDLVVQFIFVVDIIVRFFTAHRDADTYRLVVDHRSIALRYIKSDFIPDLLSCFPWDTIYKGFGRKEEVRYLVWIRLYRVRKVDSFFEKLEKDIRVNYFAARIAKLLAVEFYCTHTAACIYYYLATTVSASRESYTWIGSLTLGSFSYHDFRAIDIGKRYITSLYWAILTMATVGYGDIHAVNVREMIFVMLYVSFDMILGAYLLGNMTALIVKGSNTERFRDKMAALIKVMNRSRLPRQLRNEMKAHVRLQFESGLLTEGDDVMEDLPGSIRSKVAHARYSEIVGKVAIFKGCSTEFLDQIVSNVVEEYFLPGELVFHQGGASGQFYIVCHGVLEELFVNEDGKEDVVGNLDTGSTFGEVGLLCNIPQPYTARVSELCKLLRIDKPAFRDIIQIYFNDGQLVINNLLQVKDTDAGVGQLAADITFLVAKQAAELALMVNNASFQGDLVQLQQLVKEGAVVARADYDGRTPLHLAASRGFEAVVLYLIREGADVNAIDKFGISPLLEAVRGGHDTCMSVLMEKGSELHLQDAGSVLCQAVMNGNNELLRRLLNAGVNPSAADYDSRTALHLAAAEGAFALIKMLIERGADCHARDRWGRTALDEALQNKHPNIVEFLKEAPKQNKDDAAAFLKSTEASDSIKPSKSPIRLSGSGEFSEDSDSNPRTPTSQPRPSFSVDERSPQDKRLTSRTSNAMDFDVPHHHQYRMMSMRSRGGSPRDLFGEQQSVSTLAPRQSVRRRVTLYPYHPWISTKQRGPGKVEWVPRTVEELLNITFRHFGKLGTKLLNEDAGEISTTDFIMDSEKVYVVNDEEILGAGEAGEAGGEVGGEC